MDISHISMVRGFVYLAAVIDWYSRRVLTWRVSISMDTEFCTDAVEEAITRYGTWDIFNTDQGSQFMSSAFTGLLLENGTRISMDGKGCWCDNVFIEWVWHSIKYEEVYLHAYETVSAAREGIRCYINFYIRAGHTPAIKLEPRMWCTPHRCISLRLTQPDPAAST